MTMPGHWLAAAVLSATANLAVADAPLYDSSSDTVFDVITESDASAFACLVSKGSSPRQMWDKRIDAEYSVSAYVFEARFLDGQTIEVAVNPEFGSDTKAASEAKRIARPLGRLPYGVRSGLEFIGIHKGTPTFSAGAGKMFAYAERTDQRIAEHRLEETLFHEAVHVTLDPVHATAENWIAAQLKDGRFLTSYAEQNPTREDLAETSIFAFAILFHPGRFPPVDTSDVLAAVPARVAYLKTVFSEFESPVWASATEIGC